MVKKLIVANWKMNLLLRDSISLLESIKKTNLVNDLIICAPFVYLASLINLFPDSVFGAQDCSMHKVGAHTGDIAAAMLEDIGCRYVIHGHSERRAQYHETNATIAAKVKQAVEAKIEPIICIGEPASIKENGSTLTYLMNQLKELGIKYSDHFLVAYEPIWAIGSGVTPKASAVEELFHHIKKSYPHLRLLYGGSVDQHNAAEFLSIKNLDGLLVGGASLSAAQLNQIL